MSARKKRAPKKASKTEATQHTHPAPGRAFWSGTITFGLVSIPVDFYSATRSRQGKLRMVTADGHPVGRRYVCSRDGQPVPIEEIVRGFQVDSGEFVVVNDDELEAVAPEKTRDIDLKHFIALDELPKALMVRPYVLAPAGASTKAYRLLAETMERTDKVGIATAVIRDKAYIIAILAKDGVLLAETLRFVDELRTPQSIGLPSPVSVPQAQVKSMLRVIDDLTQEALDLTELHDDYASSMVKTVEKKAKRGQDVVQGVAEPETEETEFEAPIDLVALLKRRLEKDGAIASPQAKGASKKPSVASAKRPRKTKAAS